jgi:hypothetical protein
MICSRTVVLISHLPHQNIAATIDDGWSLVAWRYKLRETLKALV